MRLGYACAWWRPIETTWSGSSASLMSALGARSDVDLVRIDAQRNPLAAASLTISGRLRGYGVWKNQPLNQHLTDRRVRRAVAKSGVDALVAVADVETCVDIPTFFFQDANFSATRAHLDLLREYAPAIAKFPSGRLDELIDQERRAYQAAPVVLSFSEWFAQWLIEQDSVSPDCVRVVGGGLHGLPAMRDLNGRGPGGTKVLFIGRDFFRKGGDLVVAAIERLRASGAGEFTLTVVGPTSWPMPTPIPDWVDFRGEIPAHVARQLWADHDIFAMPTWYEPYGLVFLEARAAGVPILARNAYCMPELVPDGTGRLIPANGGVDAVAEQLLAISHDAELFHSIAEARETTRVECTWERVAERVVSAVREHVPG